MLVLICNLYYENQYLEEWLNFHINQNINNFILIKRDNLDKNLYLNLIGKFNKKNINIHFEETINKDFICFDIFFKKYYSMYINYWCCFIDIDEFIYSKENNINDLLTNFEKENKKAIFINWKCFGDSNLKENNTYKVLDKFVHCCEDDFGINTVGKSLIKVNILNKSTKQNNIHKPFINNDNKYYCVNGEEFNEYNKKNFINLKEIRNFYLENIFNKKEETKINDKYCYIVDNPKIIIYHYITKSLKEYEEKIQRYIHRNDRYNIEIFYKYQLFLNKKKYNNLYMDKIAVKLVIRNESNFLDEWFQYYISLGFQNYIIYDDESNDNTENIINFYSNIANIYINKINTSKREHNKHIYNYNNFDYILFVDIDEFLYISPGIYLIDIINKCKKEKISVFQIPRIDCGNKDLYYSEQALFLQTLKYNFLDNLQINKPKFIDKIPNSKYTYETKHFFDPNNSLYSSGHTSKPKENTIISSEFSKLEYTGKYYFVDNIDDLFKYNIILFHFDLKTNKIQEIKNKNHRTECIHINRKNNDMIKKKLKSLNVESNIHIDYSKKVLGNFYKKYGFLVVRNLFLKEEIQNIFIQAQNIYKTQMLKYDLINSFDITNQEFEKNIKILFENKFEIFLNCGKQCQHIIDLWKLSLDNRIIDIIKMLGIEKPIISTRPVLFSNSKHISKSDINHTVPPHQDWASMQGSINSIICWLPLIDINQDLGSIALVPKSHISGLLSDQKIDSFGIVNKFEDKDFSSLDVKQGDALFFSSFLVHKSGNNFTDNIRWSTHFRYNDLNEKNFIDNGYPHSYIYKPIDKILRPDFDTAKETNDYFFIP